MEPLPLPRARLADCVWLPRIIAKIRAIVSGELPPEYVARFCDRDSVDEHFLSFFGLAKEEMITAVQHSRNDDGAVAAWFCARPGIDAARIAAWNEFAEKLGRPGFPMERRYHDILPRAYSFLDPAKVHCIFDLIESDETGTNRRDED